MRECEGARRRIGVRLPIAPSALRGLAQAVYTSLLERSTLGFPQHLPALFRGQEESAGGGEFDCSKPGSEAPPFGVLCTVSTLPQGVQTSNYWTFPTTWSPVPFSRQFSRSEAHLQRTHTRTRPQVLWSLWWRREAPGCARGCQFEPTRQWFSPPGAWQR